MEPIEILSGIFSLVIVIIYSIVGLHIASKYREHKQRIFLYVGITWVLIASPWWPSTISFIIASLSGQGLSPEIYMIIGLVIIPIAVVIWLKAFTDLLYKDKQKIILIIFLIYGIIFEIILFMLLSIDTNLVGAVHLVDVEYHSFVRIYLLTIIALILITGVMFAKESLKSENPAFWMMNVNGIEKKKYILNFFLTKS